MLPETHMVAGGVVSAVIAVIGSLLSAASLAVLCSDTKLRTNPTTLIIIFLSLSNLLYTALVLPLNSLALLRPGWGGREHTVEPGI
jgi:hypothetical protein